MTYGTRLEKDFAKGSEVDKDGRGRKAGVFLCVLVGKPAGNYPAGPGQLFYAAPTALFATKASSASEA